MSQNDWCNSMHLDIGYEASDVGRHTFSGIATQAIRNVFLHTQCRNQRRSCYSIWPLRSPRSPANPTKRDPVPLQLNFVVNHKSCNCRTKLCPNTRSFLLTRMSVFVVTSDEMMIYADDGSFRATPLTLRASDELS